MKPDWHTAEDRSPHPGRLHGNLHHQGPTHNYTRERPRLGHEEITILKHLIGHLGRRGFPVAQSGLTTQCSSRPINIDGGTPLIGPNLLHRCSTTPDIMVRANPFKENQCIQRMLQASGPIAGDVLGVDSVSCPPGISSASL